MYDTIGQTSTTEPQTELLQHQTKT